ncbi:MAG: TetR/AcrR family transcriptional regulator [Campylobacterota bacterium]|nr:TetR/AcrR family transcriptional regulator [Campylobacterota bacterium]
MSIRKKMQELKRELILEEAGRLFNQDGYENMKVADLAKNVEVSVGTIYSLFESKENLYSAFIIAQIEHFSKIFQEELQKCDSTMKKLHKMVEIKFTAMIQNHNALRESIGNDPTVFLTQAKGENPIDGIYHMMATDVMAPLKNEFNCSRNPMEMVYLFDGLTIGQIKYCVRFEIDLMSRQDDVVNNFLKLIKED